MARYPTPRRRRTLQLRGGDPQGDEGQDGGGHRGAQHSHQARHQEGQAPLLPVSDQIQHFMVYKPCLKMHELMVLMVATDTTSTGTTDFFPRPGRTLLTPTLMWRTPLVTMTQVCMICQ